MSFALLTSTFATFALVPIAALAQAPTLTRIGGIGCGECGGVAQFAEIRDVALSDSGTLIVLGSEAPLLRAFDLAGASLWTSARRGQGPGEFQLPMRVAIGRDGFQVIDIQQRRLTRFARGGQYRSAAPVVGFATATAAQRDGALLVVIDDFRGGLTMHRWSPNDSGAAIGPLPAGPAPPAPGAIAFPAIAVAPDGSIAAARDVNVYRIQRLTADGKRLGAFTRDIPRERRTPEELAALSRLAQRAGERAAGERGRSGQSPPVLPPRGNESELKPHITIDGLRYDPTGRLWVKTMRGGPNATVFDVFAPTGAFLGEVRVETPIASYALAGRWLVAATVDDDGYAIVGIWEVK